MDAQEKLTFPQTDVKTISWDNNWTMKKSLAATMAELWSFEIVFVQTREGWAESSAKEIKSPRVKWTNGKRKTGKTLEAGQSLYLFSGPNSIHACPREVYFKAKQSDPRNLYECKVHHFVILSANNPRKALRSFSLLGYLMEVLSNKH